MKAVRHRLADIDPILYLLNDDGEPTSTIVIHGAAAFDAFATRPDPNEYLCSISRAQLMWACISVVVAIGIRELQSDPHDLELS
jgi:hypothetical protein